jgi:hypothetical protein
MKRTFYVMLLFSCLLLFASCSQEQMQVSAPAATVRSATPVAAQPTVQSDPTRTIPGGWVYTDAKLGFQLTIPHSWQALPQPGAQSSPANAAVTFTNNEQSNHALIVIGVFHGAEMPAAFAARGTPSAHVGAYPTFVADRSLGQGRAPCLVRIFLAHDDYVLADWCAPNAFNERAQFEQVLATYQPAPASFVSKATVPTQQTCADMEQQLGYMQATWGRQLANPMAAGWRQVGSGLFVCSNDSSPDWYLFQCTELANRFLYTRWALPHIPGNAARYLDYYQNGTRQPGTIRTFPTGSYQLSDDASQGRSAFRPVAGDLLIFQDVNNPRIGWTSGLTTSPGHIAVIVGVDDAYVYVAQENYSDTLYFQALPIRRVASGYEITDLSGWSARIVRGWIHFTVNGGTLPTD